MGNKSVIIKISNESSLNPGLGGSSVSSNPFETPPSVNDSVYMKVLKVGEGSNRISPSIQIR